MKIKLLQISGIDVGLQAMRNPKSNWDKSEYQKDINLSAKLAQAGPDHGKHLRFIFAYFELTAPRYLWQEFDTYRHGIEKISTSTMHTGADRKLTVNDFYTTRARERVALYSTIDLLNAYIEEYQKTRDFGIIETIKRITPESFLQKRTVVASYAKLLEIYEQRKNHRLKKEWGMINDFILDLPRFKTLTGVEVPESGGDPE